MVEDIQVLDAGCETVMISMSTTPLCTEIADGQIKMNYQI